MTEAIRVPLIDMYGGERSWCAIYGGSLFPSEQTARTYIAGEKKRKLMSIGLLFVIGKRIVTDQPEALFNAIVEMKKDDSRALASTATTQQFAPVEPLKPGQARITSLRGKKGDQLEPEPA
ncbi:hypothetical protein AB3X96_15995 [Paraburkholderia sp. BR13439]|uniref:hypothetical protein n=1 Tax=Paraburkholderia sp. BR13439 TaxID=3236996 RepID=UPI0034CF6EAB